MSKMSTTRTETEMTVNLKEEDSINRIRSMMAEINHPRIVSTRKYKQKMIICYKYSTETGIADKVKTRNYIRGMVRALVWIDGVEK